MTLSLAVLSPTKVTLLPGILLSLSAETAGSRGRGETIVGECGTHVYPAAIANTGFMLIADHAPLHWRFLTVAGVGVLTLRYV